MKTIARFSTAAIVTLAVAAFAAEREGPPERKKDLCLLYGQGCPPQGLTIQEKLRKLEQEIAKGHDVYTPEELSRLEQKLKDAEGVWDFLNN